MNEIKKDGGNYYLPPIEKPAEMEDKRKHDDSDKKEQHAISGSDEANLQDDIVDINRRDSDSSEVGMQSYGPKTEKETDEL